ncbi:hypothetical protein [Nesterenkonia pannonica]|uniref:hypothetical protein n=1 Tax=Nesterenkonia pannonica TaxID=1548602 RepID=UPI002164073B|nr:hypothetical protein [Nesterenkonia pannonica]
MAEALLAGTTLAAADGGLLGGVGIIGLIVFIIAVVMVWKSALGTVPKILLTILALIFPVIGGIIAIIVAAMNKA